MTLHMTPNKLKPANTLYQNWKTTDSKSQNLDEKEHLLKTKFKT